MRQCKLTNKQRLDAVRSYLAGAGSYEAVARHFGISARTLRDLVALYESQGEEALYVSASNGHYSAEIKQRAVEDYQRGCGSQRAICQRYQIRARNQLRNWVRQYESGDGLRSQRPASPSRHEAPSRKTTLDERVEIVSFCIAHDKDYDLTIATYQVSYQQVYNWVRKYETEGLDGLIDRRGRPRDPQSLTPYETLRAENKLLRAQIERQQIEIEALKKLRALERGWG